MSPLIAAPSRRRRAVAVLAATIALASAVSLQFPVMAQDETGASADSEPQAARGSVTQSIPADSGIAVKTLCTNCNNADLSIAGMGTQHVALYCDGILVPSGLAQIYLLAVMPPTRIDTVAATKGAGDAANPGAAVGGAIEVERVEPKPGFRLDASADVGSFDSRGLRLGVSGRSGWFGGYAVGTFNQSNKIDANEDGWADLPEYERYTVEA